MGPVGGVRWAMFSGRVDGWVQWVWSGGPALVGRVDELSPNG